MWMMPCPYCRTVIRKLRPDDSWHCARCDWPRDLRSPQLSETSGLLKVWEVSW